MKQIIFVGLMLVQTSMSFAQSDNSGKCEKDLCLNQQVNTELKKYCSQAPEEFQNSVADWGPYLSVDGINQCWCSCKHDVSQK